MTHEKGWSTGNCYYADNHGRHYGKEKKSATKTHVATTLWYKTAKTGKSTKSRLVAFSSCSRQGMEWLLTGTKFLCGVLELFRNGEVVVFAQFSPYTENHWIPNLRKVYCKYWGLPVNQKLFWSNVSYHLSTSISIKCYTQIYNMINLHVYFCFIVFVCLLVCKHSVQCCAVQNQALVLDRLG